MGSRFVIVIILIIISSNKVAFSQCSVKPNILTTPINQTVCKGKTVLFSVTVRNGITYQWGMRRGNSLGIVLSNNRFFSGVNTPTLKIQNIPDSLDGYTFYCHVNTCWWAGSGVLTVAPLPKIITQPSDRTSCTGFGNSFDVYAGKDVDYQWQVDDGNGWANLSNSNPYSGVTSTRLIIKSTTASMDGYKYRCIVNGCIKKYSREARLTVAPLPQIITQPSDRTSCTGFGNSFDVYAGKDVDYQWQVDDGNGWANLSNSNPYSGVTSTRLIIKSTTASMDGYKYRCIVNGCIKKYSREARLTVAPLPQIITQPSDRTSCTGFGNSFDVYAGKDVDYQWQVDDGNGWANLSNSNPYSGVTSTRLIIKSTTASMDGYKYRCVVNGCISMYSREATLKVAPLPKIITHPSDCLSSICTGDTAHFSIVAVSGVSCQWQVNDGSGWANLSNNNLYQGVVSMKLTIRNTNASMDGNKYRCIVNGCIPKHSKSAILKISSAPIIISKPSSITVNSGNSATFSVQTVTSRLSYQWWEGTTSGIATPVSNVFPYTGTNTSTLTISTTNVSMNGNKYYCMIDNCWGVAGAILNVNNNNLNGNAYDNFEDIVLSPNPVKGSTLNLQIKSNVSKITSIEIFDMFGRLVMKTDLSFSESGQAQIDVSKLQTGLHTIRLDNTNEPATFVKFIKK